MKDNKDHNIFQISSTSGKSKDSHAHKNPHQKQAAKTKLTEAADIDAQNSEENADLIAQLKKAREKASLIQKSMDQFLEQQGLNYDEISLIANNHSTMNDSEVEVKSQLNARLKKIKQSNKKNDLEEKATKGKTHRGYIGDNKGWLHIR